MFLSYGGIENPSLFHDRAVLLERFLEEPPSPPKEDPYEHVALILTNVTRLPGGRRLLLAPGRRTLAALACQLDPARARLRRAGCASALRNCCFRAEVRAWIPSLALRMNVQ